MKRSVTKGKLLERKSDERHVFEVVNELQAILAQEIRTRVQVSTSGNGTLVPVWTDEIKSGEAFMVTATVVGRYAGGANWYNIQGGYRNNGGVLTIIGGSLSVTQREDTAAADATLTVAGTNLSLSVRDDGANAMAWTAYLTIQAAA